MTSVIVVEVTTVQLSYKVTSVHSTHMSILLTTHTFWKKIARPHSFPDSKKEYACLLIGKYVSGPI